MISLMKMNHSIDDKYCVPNENIIVDDSNDTILKVMLDLNYLSKEKENKQKLSRICSIYRKINRFSIYQELSTNVRVNSSSIFLD